MEYRKLISFGKNSFVISLPKAWIRHSKLKKGDLIYVEEASDHLVLRPHLAKEQEEERKMTIDVDGKTIPLLTRELNAAYIENYREVTFKGKELKEKSKDILDMVRKLIALEVLELDSEHIVTKDFLDMDKVSVKDLIKKMDIIVRSMLKDCNDSFDEDNVENLQLRDEDVNRLSFLVYRAIRHGLRNPSQTLKLFNFTTVDLLNYYWTTFHLEAIADETKRIVRAMDKTSLPKNKQKDFITLLQNAQNFYLDVIKSHFVHDRQKALLLSTRKKPLVKSANKFFDENEDFKRTSYMVDRYRRLVGIIHELDRLTYQH
ncbi:phosphate uptake regulator PhoU [Candidatus Woesearchaeota archaeon]|jgi:phosphate uptake regulator|nr:phosphate uptake regulator PhoU [Candidatus Woesearchaeota archaeon]MBT4150604.1 phosphate uptake regulator PhoU [Candidatus Woesearchaeota archaeon]MBT4247822.1 phosphate uptake regulator PhoU [Candidatus Woesearchaeota archaeon]MBT4434246.1 phosphate uptake regulator PhoU [Candidatus Woesearchaeota archaeon]MBT7331833.1 phosphate uptake regulator PhoU [Candidatus Woesearchaeota archaeon]